MPPRRKPLKRRVLPGRSARRRSVHTGNDKVVEPGVAVRCKVRVFPLRVTHQLKTWPEKRQRHTQWHSPSQASRRVREAHLAEIIRTFAKKRKEDG